MSGLKHVVLAIAWMAASMPCLHAAEVEDHAHGNAPGVELCASADHACHCHSCEEHPCVERTIEPFKRSYAGGDTPVWSVRVVLLTLPESGMACPPNPMKDPPALAALQTVQLLI